MIGIILEHRYRVVELIGTGGMSHVYRAVNLLTQKSVAIKVLKAEYRENPEFLRRFELEAKAVLHLSHENIVHAYGVGEYDGMPYIVLEYVEGRSLKEILQERGAMPQRTAANICSQILGALSAAHAAGIIHRDVKPQNVIITPEGKAKLTDFGIARDVQATTVTFAGSTVLGSAHYLSPEQAKGQPVTAASDLYSAGVMMYEMLTGDVPFAADSTVSVALKHINDTPLPPIELNPRIYPSVNEFVLRALAKNPSERFSSADKMLYALQRAMKDPDAHPAQRSENLSQTQEIHVATDNKVTQPHAMLRPIVVIGLVIGVFVGVLIGTFFGIRSTFKNDQQVQPLIPTVTGKQLTEALERAESYGFRIEISEYEVNATVAEGTVISQNPSPGSSAKAGTSIKVTVSAGPDVPAVPQLIGLTYDEAIAALQSLGLQVGTVTYRVSDVAIGYVCAQYPSDGTELQEGATVDLCLSATTISNEKMPALTSMQLEEALSRLDMHGYTNIFLRYDATSVQPLNTVLSQTPAADSTVQPEMRIELLVAGTPQAGYFSDIAYNLNIEKSGTQVVITMEDVRYGVKHERILFDSILEKGEKVPVSFTATAPSGGIHELILYINGVEARRQDTGFVKAD